MTMQDLETILQLYSQGNSQNTISAYIGIGRTTVSKYLHIAEDALGVETVSWPLNEEQHELLESVLNSITREKHCDGYVFPDFEQIHKDLLKPNVTLLLLHNEYVQEVAQSDRSYYSYNHFVRLYRDWCHKKKLIMRIPHKPGDVLEYDWAGQTISYTNPATSKKTVMYLYVAALPYSLHFYTDAFPDMTLSSWITATCDAFEHFDGVPRLMRPDNLKTAVITHTRNKITLQKNFHELSRHYNSAIVPTGVRRPTHKSTVESRVKVVERWILAALRNQNFYSADGLRNAVREKMDELNHKFSKALDASPYDMYMREEKQFMKPLPPTRYEMSTWFSCTVGPDYLVTVDKNKYSVPYTYHNEHVDVQVKNNRLNVYYQGKLIAEHEYVEEKNRNPYVLKEHMPKSHQAVTEYTPDDLRAYAATVGPATAKAFEFYLTRGEAEEQGIQFCVSLKAIAERNSPEKLEEACLIVQANGGTPLLEHIDAYLMNRKEKKVSKETFDQVAHRTTGITRGASQFHVSIGHIKADHDDDTTNSHT